MKNKSFALLNLLGLVLVIVVNALANILPINGYNTGEISGFYPNYFVPAGFTFGIWGIIYILLIGFVCCSLFAAFGRFDAQAKEAILAISPLFQLTCLLNAGWIVVWHHLWLPASLLIMLVFLYVLIRIYLRLKPFKMSMPSFHRIWIHHAFLVYLGWISVATIANITALLVGYGWTGGLVPPHVWSIIMIVVAILLGVFMVGGKKEPAFGWVLSWALFGVYVGQKGSNASVGWAAAIGVCLLLALSITILIPFRRTKTAE